MRSLVLLSFLTATVALGQSERSELMLSGGEAVQLDVRGYDRATSTSLGGSYGFRLFRHLGLETGIVTALDPTGVVRGENYNSYTDIKDRFTWVQFGPRFVLPLWDGRFELSAGAGGAYEKYTVGNPNFGYAPRSGWGGNFSAGAAIALDPGRRFWLGMAPRWFLVNAGAAHDRWFIAAGEFSFRF